MYAMTYAKAAGVVLVVDQDGKKGFPHRILHAASEPKTFATALLYKDSEET